MPDFNENNISKILSKSGWIEIKENQVINITTTALEIFEHGRRLQRFTKKSIRAIEAEGEQIWNPYCEPKKRKPIKPGKKMKADAANRRYLNKFYRENQIDYCERCGSRLSFTSAHPTTRQHIKGKEALKIAARFCLKCHVDTEGKPNQKEEVESAIERRFENYWKAA